MAQHKRDQDMSSSSMRFPKVTIIRFCDRYWKRRVPRYNGSNSIQSKSYSYFFFFFVIIFVPLPSCVPVGQKGSIIANLTMRPLYENHNWDKCVHPTTWCDQRSDPPNPRWWNQHILRSWAKWPFHPERSWDQYLLRGAHAFDASCSLSTSLPSSPEGKVEWHIAAGLNEDVEIMRRNLGGGCRERL